jgi:ABC-2 type transport system permease protein
MNTAPRQAPPATAQHWRPNTLALGLNRTVVDIRIFNRDPLSLVLTLFFPVIMMGLFGSVFGTEPSFGAGPGGAGGITPAHYYLPGMLALGTILSGFQNLSNYVAAERFNGAIKRLAGTPLPVLSYFLGKTGQTLYVIGAQSILLLLAARFLFDVPLPETGEQWLTAGWLILLGTAAWSAVGIAFASLPRTAQSASALAVIPVLLLAFTSGVYFPFSQLPEWLQNLANLFPLRWTASGLRSAFLPEEFAAAEPGGVWNVGLSAAVLLAWLAVGLLAARLTFKWPPGK